jgi:hypothetical protein
MHRHTLCMMSALGLATAALADEPPLQLWDERYLTLRAGATAQMLLHASVREGYVVVARAGQRSKLVPLTLKLEPPDQLKIGKVAYPSPDLQPAKLGSIAPDTPVYSGTIAITLAISAPVKVDPGAHEVKGRLTYQACDAKRCMPAVTIPVELIITIRKPPEK